MRFKNTLKLVVAVLACELAGFVGSLFTAPSISSGWYGNLVKPEFAPPNWIFAPVWTTLFLMMGVAVWLVWKKGVAEQGVKIALIFFDTQLLLNVLWSVVFFGLRSPGLAVIEIIFLWFAILVTIVSFAKVSKLSALLLVPYILWVSFAGYLNYEIFSLTKNAQTVYCPQDAKICPDGSYISRTPPNCDFKLCPKENLIKTNSPAQGQNVFSPVAISGEARGTWFFEATFPIKIYGEKGEIISQGYAQAKSDWMTESFVPFESSLEFEVDRRQNGVIVLEKNNPSGLAEHYDEIKIPVTLNPAKN